MIWRDALIDWMVGMRMNKIYYSIICFSKDIIILSDESILLGGKTITNGVEQILQELSKLYGKDVKIIYRDTDGNYDQIIHSNFKFIDFKCLNTKNRYEAIENLNAKN